MRNKDKKEKKTDKNGIRKKKRKKRKVKKERYWNATEAEEKCKKWGHTFTTMNEKL